MKKKIGSAIIWGDSVARGVVFDETRNRYSIAPYTAAAMVGEQLGIEIKNRSRMGMTSSDGMLMMEKDLKKGLHADAAIIEFGGNDCDFNWNAISEAPDTKHLPKTTAEQYQKNIRTMIDKAHNAGMEPILVNLTPINAENYFQFISRGGLSQENILHWLGDKFQIYRYQERYSMLVSRIAHECGCRLLDIRSALLGVWDVTTSLFCRDGIHPTAEGQKVIGQAILNSL